MAAVSSLDRGVLLPGGADGGCRSADQAAVRPRLQHRPVRRRRADDGLTSPSAAWLPPPWVQIIKACMLLAGGTLVMVLAMSQFGFSFEKMMTQAISLHSLGEKLLFPGSLLPDPVTALSLGPWPDVRYRRSAAHPDALLHRDQRQGSPQVGALRVRFRRLLLQRDPADGLRGHHHRRPEPRVLRRRQDRRQDRRWRAT